MVFFSARFFWLSIDEMLRQDTPNHLGAWDIHHPDLFLRVPNIKHSRKELTTLEFTQKLGGGNKNYGFPKKKMQEGGFPKVRFWILERENFIPPPMDDKILMGIFSTAYLFAALMTIPDLPID